MHQIGATGPIFRVCTTYLKIKTNIMDNNRHKGSEFSNVSEQWAQNEINKKREEAENRNENPSRDYWERQRDNAASGYRIKDDRSPLQNENPFEEG
jgi:hypothetical protein